MRSSTRATSYVLRPGLAFEYLGADIALLDASGNESSRVSGEAADVVRTLLSRRHATATELGASDELIAELSAKGFVDAVRTPSRRGVIAAGAAGVTALALPSHVAAESVGGSGGLAPQIPGAPTNLFVTNGDSAVQISFTAGTAGGGTITNHEYSTDGGTTWVALSPADATSPVVITTTSNTGAPLANGTTYSIMLRARNSENETGVQSTAVSATPSPLATHTRANGSTVNAGTEITVDGLSYRYHRYTANQNFVLHRTAAVEYLIAGGGGGGGGHYAEVASAGGGGGGGGVRIGTFTTLTPATYPITVGQGGAGSTVNDGGSGTSSSFNSISSAGGGGGGDYQMPGLSGGSGGGGGSYGGAGGSGNTPNVDPAQGFSGGAGGTTAGGGGGGAAGSGSASSGTTGGAGGPGVVSSITGTSATYGTGGSGGSSLAAGTQDSGYAHGGGGSGTNGQGSVFGAQSGLGGVVIVRYRIPQQIWD